MLVSIALAPGVLSPPAAHPDRIRSLASVLHAVSQNGILVTPDTDSLRAAIVRAAAAAQDARAQRLQVVAPDIAKDIELYAISPPPEFTLARGCTSPCESCVSAARWGRADAVIVADEAERQACVDAGAPLDRLLLLDDFQDGPLDLRRSGWRQTQRLDLLTNDEARALVGGVVRYAKKLVVADKMIGVSAKDGSTKVGKHLSGVGYLIEAWAEASPYAGIIPLEIEIMTVAGSAGARAGFVDPILVRSAITSAMRVVDRNRRLGHLTITLKQDGEVPIFNDRLLVCGRRTWGIQHGFDDLGKLGRSGIRRPTMIDPPSDARGTVFRDIQSLRDL